LVYNLPAHVVAARDAKAVFDIAIYPASAAKPKATTYEALTQTLSELVSDNARRVRSYLLHTDWALNTFEIEEHEKPLKAFRITLHLHRTQYQGSSRAGLERLLTFIEGTLWGAHGFKVGADGDPVVSRD
jgi:hypothetical protein